jgi:hypothetical protein
MLKILREIKIAYLKNILLENNLFKGLKPKTEGQVTIGKIGTKGVNLELVSKELNHLAAILHVYTGGLNLMK